MSEDPRGDEAEKRRKESKKREVEFAIYALVLPQNTEDILTASSTGNRRNTTQPLIDYLSVISLMSNFFFIDIKFFRYNNYYYI